MARNMYTIHSVTYIDVIIIYSCLCGGEGCSRHLHCIPCTVITRNWTAADFCLLLHLAALSLDDKAVKQSQYQALVVKTDLLVALGASRTFFGNVNETLGNYDGRKLEEREQTTIIVNYRDKCTPAPSSLSSFTNHQIEWSFLTLGEHEAMWRVWAGAGCGLATERNHATTGVWRQQKIKPPCMQVCTVLMRLPPFFLRTPMRKIEFSELCITLGY